MNTNPHIVLCASCRIALGKLRRTTNIASALKRRDPTAVLTLMADSGKEGVAGALAADELPLFDSILSVPSAGMAQTLKTLGVDVVVVDTMNVRNLHEVNASLCLVLREVIENEQRKFRLGNERSWDLVILPNPAGRWTPSGEIIGARNIHAVGWIYRVPEQGGQPDRRKDTPTVLITTGGGSGEDRGNDIHAGIQELLFRLRQKSKTPLKLLQVVGPRDRDRKQFEGVDEMIEPGPELHHLFPAVDLVISAAGYNSVLELAATDVPVLFTPVPRYSDDQEKRAQRWGEELGMCYTPDQLQQCVDWMTHVLESRSRRPIVDLGPSGADTAAQLILQLAATKHS